MIIIRIMNIVGNKNRFLVTLAEGEPIMSTLTQICQERNLSGATITGIGAICKAELGYYQLASKSYLRKTFEDEHELVSATGDFSLKEGEPFVHMHISIADSSFQMYGGHLFEAYVTATAEFAITELTALPKREYSEHIGLHLICGLAD